MHSQPSWTDTTAQGHLPDSWQLKVRNCPLSKCPEAEVLTTFKANDLGTMEAAAPTKVTATAQL